MPADPILAPPESAQVSTILAPPELSKSDLKKLTEKEPVKETKTSSVYQDPVPNSQKVTSTTPSTPKPLFSQILPQKEIAKPEVLLPSTSSEEPPIVIIVRDAAKTAGGSGEVDPQRISQETQVGRTLISQQGEASLLSSLTFLVNRSFSFTGGASGVFLRGFVPSDKSILGSNLILPHQFLSNLSSDFTIRLLNPSESKLTGEFVSNASLFALSIGLLGVAQLDPAQVFSLALAYSLGLSSHETTELLKYLNQPYENLLSLNPLMTEQARFLAPLMQGVILNDPAAMKGFLAQLFSPALKVLMSLFLMKELNFNHHPSTLLAELGSLMARSAQRRRQRYRTRVGRSDRVSRKDPSLFTGVDPQDEGYEPEDEIEWWDQLYSLYPPRETNSFLWM